MSDEFRPTADPTLLTTQQVQREVAALEKLITVRLDAMDRAVGLLQDNSNRSPTINEVYLQHEAQFASIATQFAERDVRTQQAAEASTTAVNAALQAQKESAGKQAEAFQEATSKSEQQFTKQIDQQGELLKTEVRGLGAQINELKDRFNRGEGKVDGADKHKTDTRGNIGLMIAGAAAFIALCGFLIADIFKR